MRIAVDAMGSDAYPVPDVAGAVLAAREWGDEILLVGDKQRIEIELAKYDTSGLKISVVHADQVIEMTDKPADSARHKPESSMHVGLRLVRDRAADTFVTAGNTGAVLAVATLYTLKRLRGIKRPALTVAVPHLRGHFVSSDIGANADCKPEHLLQFAMMANLYARLALGVPNPRVALLSNGEEEEKGNELIKETAPLMRKLSNVNYIGNAEPKEALSGEVDVLIHDGFSGNVLIKSIEAAASMMNNLIREEIRAGAISTLGGALARPAFKRVRKRIDPFEVGGAILLGLDGVVIIGHGRSNDIGIKNAIRQAREAMAGRIVEAIQSGV